VVRQLNRCAGPAEFTIVQTRRARSFGGFTLVELMIVVVVLGILATIAGVGYRRYVARARIGEAVAMLAEMSSKEQLYFLEFAAYLPLRADNAVTTDEPVAAFYPVSPSDGAFYSSRLATSIKPTTAWPQSWRSVGLRPKAEALYCTYMLNAGAAGAVPTGAYGALMLPTAPAPWYYALAACNLDGDPGFPAAVTTFGITSTSPALRSFNEGK
jgi:prepilin-type N-terminal cleavage/methylation domain-containing protein